VSNRRTAPNDADSRLAEQIIGHSQADTMPGDAGSPVFAQPPTQPVHTSSIPPVSRPPSVGLMRAAAVFALALVGLAAVLILGRKPRRR
jgi:V8-like Glu-specific endopeptidase